jgi:hypothetical protein
MFALDLFNNDHERRLAEGAVDRLEQRRIDDLAMKMDDLVARAKTATTPEAKAALVKEFQKRKAERDSYFKIKDECMGYGGLGEAGVGHDIADKAEKIARATPQSKTGAVASTVKNAAKWLAGKGGPGKEGPTYEAQDQKKNSKEVIEGQRLHVGDPVVITAPNEFEGKTGEIAEFSPSGKFVVVNLYNHGEHSMHLSDVEYNQYADKQEEDDWYDEEEMDEGWSNKIVAQRTGQLPTPYSVFIKGKEWKSFADDDHAEAVANKLRAKFEREGRDPSVITIAPTDYDKGMDEALSRKDLVKQIGDKLNDPEFRKQPADSSKRWEKGDLYQGPGPDDYGYTGYQGHGMPVDKPKKKTKEAMNPPKIQVKKNKGVTEAEGRVDPILIKALNNMPDGLASHREVLDAAYDAYAMELGKMRMKSEYGTTREYIPKLMGLYKDKHGLTFNEAANPAQQAAIAIAKKKEQGMAETALNPKDPKGDYASKLKALQDLSLTKGVDQRAVQQRKLDLEKEARTKGVKEAKADPTGSWVVYNDKGAKRFKTHTGAKAYAEKNGGKVASSEFYQDKIQKQGVAETVTDVRSEMARVYQRLAPKIERHRDSFLAGQLYDELENIAELHGAEAEFNRMMAGAKNRAHMDYDTNPGGFQNWFWYLPFAEEVNDEEDLAEDQDTSAVESAIIRRIMVAHTDLLKQFGPEKVMQAAEEVAYNVGDVDEIGTSDVSAYVNQVKQILGVPEELDEKWTEKYKRSIDCSNPKGFSQRAHCAGRKK